MKNKRNKGDLFMLAMFAYILAGYVEQHWVSVLLIVYGAIMTLNLLIEVSKTHQQRNIKVLNVDEMDFPPELKEKVDSLGLEIRKFVESKHPETKHEKCNNPHCPHCWNL